MINENIRRSLLVSSARLCSVLLCQLAESSRVFSNRVRHANTLPLAMEGPRSNQRGVLWSFEMRPCAPSFSSMKLFLLSYDMIVNDR